MASKSKSKNKPKKFQLEIEARKFGVEDRCISHSERDPNNYPLKDFITVISRKIFIYQMCYRDPLRQMFTARLKSTNFQNFEDVRNLLKCVIAIQIKRTMDIEEEEEELCIVVPAEKIADEFTITISVINELVIFLYTNNCPLHLKELAKFWNDYWAGKKRDDLRKSGAIEYLYVESDQLLYEEWDTFYNTFIPEVCIPYEKCDSELPATFSDRVQDFFRDVYSNLPEDRKNEIRHYTGARGITFFQMMSVPDDSGTGGPQDLASELDIPVNAGLGIPTHEEVVQKLGFSGGSSSTQDDVPATSQTTRVRRESYRQKKVSRAKRTQPKTGSDEPSESNVPEIAGLGRQSASATGLQNITAAASRLDVAKSRSFTQKKSGLRSNLASSSLQGPYGEKKSQHSIAPLTTGMHKGSMSHGASELNFPEQMCQEILKNKNLLEQASIHCPRFAEWFKNLGNEMEMDSTELSSQTTKPSLQCMEDLEKTRTDSLGACGSNLPGNILASHPQEATGGQGVTTDRKESLETESRSRDENFEQMWFGLLGAETDISPFSASESGLRPDADHKESSEEKEAQCSVEPDGDHKESSEEKEAQCLVEPDGDHKESSEEREAQRSVEPDEDHKESSEEKKAQDTASSLPSEFEEFSKLRIED